MASDKANQDKKDVVIKVRGLVNGFGDKIIHDHLDLDVYRGEVLGVVGGSGAGKSVLLRTIIGLNKPREGTIEVFGKRHRRIAEGSRMRRAGDALGRAVPGRRAVLLPDRGGEHPGAACANTPRCRQELMDEIAAMKLAHGGPARRTRRRNIPPNCPAA